MVNLRLYQRWQELIAADAEYAAAERGLAELLEEQQAVYALRVFHAVAAVDEVNRRDKMPAVRAAAVTDGIRALRALDSWHLDEVAASRQQFYAATQIGERESVRAHRRELAELVDDSAGMVITGGHVGVLLHLLHVFGLVTMIKKPVITWSAGAMALSDRVVLFGTHRPAGRRLPEVWAEGLGVFSGVLAVPPSPAPAADARPVPARPAGAPVQGLDVPAVRRRRTGRPDRWLAATGGRAVDHPGRCDLGADRGPRDRGTGGRTVRRQRSAGPAPGRRRRGDGADRVMITGGRGDDSTEGRT